ncbi:MAG: PAS domain S-box protein [Anaerolineae bacterium]|nr:PAS domain S-box protein [Anaerolineae bacterium]
MRSFTARFDIRVSAVYGGVAALWIVLSDILIGVLFAQGQTTSTLIGVLKGLGFVWITSLALFAILSAEMRKRGRVEQALQQDMIARQQAEAQYRSLFENSPVSLWEEDFSAVKAYLDNLRASGQDLRAYLTAHPEAVVHCAELVKVLSINRATLDMFHANSPEELMGGLATIITTTSFEAFREELLTLAAGQLWFEGELTEQPLRGDPIECLLKLTIVQGYEDTWAKVFVAIMDITKRKQDEQALLHSETTEREQRVLAEALRDTTIALTSTLDPAMVLDRILQHLERVIPHQAANIMLIKGEVACSVCWHGYPPEAEDFLKTFAFPLDTPNLREMLTTRAPLVIPDTVTYPGWMTRSETTCSRSYAGVPIQIRNQVVGFLSMDSTIPGFFTANHTQRLLAFANQTAVAIENAQLYDELWRYATDLQQRVMERTAELKRAKEHVEAILDSSSDGIILAHLTKGIQQANAAFNALFACEPDAYFHTPLTGLAMPDDIPHMQQAIGDAVNNRISTHLEIEALRQDGTTFLADISVAPVSGSSIEPDQVVCILRDITRRKQAEQALRESEERFRSYFELPLIGVMISAPDKAFLQVNAKLCEMLGYTRDELLQKTWAELTYVDDLPTNEAYFRQAMAGEIDGYTFDKRFVRKDGQLIYCSLVARCVRKPNGQVNYVVALAQDITERKRLEAELRHTLDKEKELNELKSRFVSLVSHEFRTPLATIQTATDLLHSYSSKLTDEQKAARLKGIQTQVHRMTTMLEQVLTISRIEQGKLTFKPAPLNVEVFCRELIETLQQTVHTHQFVFSSAIGKQLCNMDVQLLEHILSNLLTNAVKYSPPGSTVYFELQEQAKQVKFMVRDEGIGIPLEDQPYIFEPFHRANNVGQVAGTGLGLAIVRQMVERHSGSVVFDSEPGVGTSFTVSIPAHPAIDASHTGRLVIKDSR